MTIESLEYFFAIANGATYLEVAEAFYLSQSSLSKAIKRLEKELGTQLFDRSGRAVKLTDAGQLLLNDLRPLHDPYLKLKKDMAMVSSLCNISCYIRPSSSVLGLRNIIRSFSEEYPWITVSLRDDKKPGNVIQLLKDGEINFAIMHQSPRGLPQHHETFLINDYVVIILPEQHPLAAQESVSLEALQSETFYLILRTSDLLKKTCDFLKLAPPPSVLTNMNREELLWHIATDHKLALFYASDISSFHLHGVVARKITGLPDQPYVMVSNPDYPMKKEHVLFQNFITKHVQSFPMDIKSC